MTDDKKIEAVTAKLIGEFYVGQRVKVSGCSGTVCDMFGYFVVVDLDLGRKMVCERPQSNPTMTNDEKICAVTSKLTGKFYVLPDVELAGELRSDLQPL